MSATPGTFTGITAVMRVVLAAEAAAGAAGYSTMAIFASWFST